MTSLLNLYQFGCVMLVSCFLIAVLALFGVVAVVGLWHKWQVRRFRLADKLNLKGG